MMTDQPSFWTRHYEITADAADLSTDLTPLLTALAPSFQDLLAVQLPFHVKAIVTYRISRTVRLTDDSILLTHLHGLSTQPSAWKSGSEL